MVRAAADLAPTLASLLGKHCEIIVHSLEDPDHAAIAVANARLTSRALHSPIQEQGLLTLQEKMADGGAAYFCRSERGQRLKAAVFPIVNGEGRCLGGLSLALNLDAPFAELMQALTPGAGGGQEQGRVFGRGPVDIEETVARAVRNADRDFGGKSRNRAKAIIAELHEKGIFKVRNAVQIVGERAGISPATVYWHLRELKKQDGE